MSDDAIKSLNRRIEELMGENAQLKAEAKDRRIKGKKAQGDLEQLRKDLAAVTKERDGLKERSDAAPSELQAKVAELQGVIRDGKHRDAFREAATGAGVDAGDVADLWTLSGYKAEADEPDAAGIASLIEAQKKARPRFFGQAADAGKPAETPAKPARLEVPEDAGRGGSRGAAPAAFRVTAANLQDLGWMQKNAGPMKAAREAGTLVFE